MIAQALPSIAKFTDFVQLKDYRQPTKDEYVRYVRKLAEHHRADPATLTEDQLRAYFLLRQGKQFGGSAMKLARCALRNFYRDCLRLAADWTVFEEVRIASPQTLPLVLDRTQVATLLGAVREPRYRTLLTFIYHTGLRDTGTEHPRLHVRCGKGGRDRFVPLAPAMVQALRAWWKTHRHLRFRFPGPTAGWRERAQPADAAAHAATHLSVSAVQNTFRLARAATGLPASATVHTLRHCRLRRRPLGSRMWSGSQAAGFGFPPLSAKDVLLIAFHLRRLTSAAARYTPTRPALERARLGNRTPALSA